MKEEIHKEKIANVEVNELPSQPDQEDGFLGKWSYFFIVALGLLIIFNQYLIINAGAMTTQTATTGFIVKSTGNLVQDAMNAIIPRGVPFYGSALGVSFEDPVNSLRKLASLHKQVPTNSLTQDELKRYINVGTKISCEFCCSAPSVVDSSGRDLCGCAHAQSFMGLSKYLIKNSPQLTDEQILTELTRWKALYYPRNMVEKGVAALQNGLPLTPAVLNDRNLLIKVKNKDLSSIGQLPQMVGGC